MSHAMGTVWSLEGKILGYFEYNGTADVAYSAIHDTCDQVKEGWRTASNSRDCLCARKDNRADRSSDGLDGPGHGTLVILYTNYARGSCWLGRACFKCKAITDGYFPTAIAGLPFDLPEEEIE